MAAVLLLLALRPAHGRVVDGTMMPSDAQTDGRSWTYLSRFVFDSSSIVDDATLSRPIIKKDAGKVEVTSFDQLSLWQGGAAHVSIDFKDKVWADTVTIGRSTYMRPPDAALAQMHLLIYSSGWDSWKKVRSSAMTCGEKVEYARTNGNAFPLSVNDDPTVLMRNVKMPVGQTALRRAPEADGLYGGRNPLVPGAWRWNEGGTKAETIITFSTTRPHSFFFAFAWCQKAKRIKPDEPVTSKQESLWRVPASSDANGDVTNVKFRLEMRNMPLKKGDESRKDLTHFGADEVASYYLSIIGVAWSTGLVLAMQATQLILACKMKLHRIVTFLACAIMLQCLGMVCLLCEKVWYASTGVDMFWLSFFAQLLPQIAETIVLFDLILVAKGYAITRRKLSAATWKKVFTFVVSYACLQILLFAWAKFGYNEEEAVYYMQVPPGFVLVLMRGFAVPWILWSITTSLRKKRKRRFFIGFAIFSVIWIGSYPMLWLLSWAVPEYTRAQVMLGLEICLAHGSQTILVILIFPLWPNFQITLCGKKWGFGCFPFHKTTWEVDDPVTAHAWAVATNTRRRNGGSSGTTKLSPAGAASNSSTAPASATAGTSPRGSERDLIAMNSPGGGGNRSRTFRQPRLRRGGPSRDGDGRHEGNDSENDADDEDHSRTMSHDDDSDDGVGDDHSYDSSEGDDDRPAERKRRVKPRLNFIDRARQRSTENQVPSRNVDPNAPSRANTAGNPQAAGQRRSLGPQQQQQSSSGGGGHDPWSPPPVYVRTTAEKEADRKATQQLRAARRYAIFLQLRTEAMVAKAAEVLAALDELTIPDAGGDEWFEYVHAREEQAEAYTEEQEQNGGGVVSRYRQRTIQEAFAARGGSGSDGGRIEMVGMETTTGETQHPTPRRSGSIDPTATDETSPSDPSYALPGRRGNASGRASPRSSRSVERDQEREPTISSFSGDRSTSPRLAPTAIRRTTTCVLREEDEERQGRGFEETDLPAEDEADRRFVKSSDDEGERGSGAGATTSAPRRAKKGWATARTKLQAASALKAPVVERRIERILRERKERQAREAESGGGAASATALVEDEDSSHSHSHSHSPSNRGRSPSLSSVSSEDAVVAAALASSDDHWMDQSSDDHSPIAGSRGLTTRLRQADKQAANTTNVVVVSSDEDLL